MRSSPAKPAIRMSHLRGKVQNSSFVGGRSLPAVLYKVWGDGKQAKTSLVFSPFNFFNIRPFHFHVAKEVPHAHESCDNNVRSVLSMD